MEKAINTKKTKNPFKFIPWWGWVGSLVFLLIHIGFYLPISYAVRTYANNFWSYCPKIPGLDDAIPFVPYFFAQLYYVSYAVWFIAPLMVSVTGKRNFTNFIIYSFIAHVIGAMLFLLAPSWEDRVAERLLDVNGNPGELIENIKTPFTKWMMTIITGNDGGTMAWNMAPSFHILTTFFCVTAVVRQKKIHISARIIDYLFAILISIGVLFIKQHYIFDVFAAIALGAIVYIIVVLCDPAKKILEKHPNFLEIKHKKKGK